MKHLNRLVRVCGTYVAPSRGRGLKLVYVGGGFALPGRPFTGAWIETSGTQTQKFEYDVAPSRGRGLKLVEGIFHAIALHVAPSRGRGLKPGLAYHFAECGRSPLHGGVD